MNQLVFRQMVNELIFELSAKNMTIGTAEHCSCGLVGASIASMANLCAGTPLYKGSITVNDVQNLTPLLDVSENAIKDNGLTSSQVACQMAVGGLYKMDVDICLSVVGDIKNGVVWLCSARRMSKCLNFRYKQLLLKGTTNSENYNRIIEESIEIATLHAGEKDHECE